MYDPWPGKWMRRAITALLVLIPLLLAALTYYRFTDAATASDQRALQERQDCARVIANEQSAVKDAAFIAKARLDQAYIDAQLIVRDDPAQVDTQAKRLASLTADLERAIAAMATLPPSQDLVDRRCPAVSD